MIALLVAVFLASVMGSLHCAGMCGPFCGVAVSGGRSRREAALCHTAYHGGRLVMYSLLGAAAGAVGGLLDLASTLAGLQPIALGLAGGVMVLIGAGEIARLKGWRAPLGGRLRLPKAWTNILQRGQRFASRRRGVPRALAIGLLTTLLPCGWLYAFLVTAAGTGSPLGGALVMAVFGVGTVPVLLSLGLGLRRLTAAFGESLPMATAVALVLVGVVTLTSRAHLSPQAIAAIVEQENRGQSAPDPDQLPPCCRARGVTE